MGIVSQGTGKQRRDQSLFSEHEPASFVTTLEPVPPPGCRGEAVPQNLRGNIRQPFTMTQAPAFCKRIP